MSSQSPGGRLSQDQQYLSITTPLGKDRLVLTGLDGEDGLSTLFRYRLKLLSEDKDVSFAGLVGKPATVTIRLGGDAGSRVIDGILTAFEMTHFDDRENLAYYEAELRPWLYLLTLSGDCRVFQEKTVPDIVAELCRQAGFNHVQTRLTNRYPPREYCVQYDESDYNFIARLLEQEGIFYHFSHSTAGPGGGRHELVLGDDQSAVKPCPGVERLRYRPRLADDDADDVLTGIRYQHALATRAFGVDSYNFQAPATPLFSSAEGQGGFGTVNRFRGDYLRSADGERYARILQQAAAAPAALIHGFGQARSLSAGYSFVLGEHPRQDINGTYVVRRLRIEASRQRYQASFDALPLSVPFRPSDTAQRPRIHSSQTAVVVGKPGEEIWVDSYGRIKVQFHWDRHGRRDHQSSCWIRVAQNWAGKAFGTMFLPRVGQEVIVSFIDGDPDRPIVTGAVYNADQTVPYALPANSTRSTIKTRSTKDLAGGSNEIRFEDKKDAEELYIHAQKDLTAEIGHDLATTVGGNETHHVKRGAGEGAGAGGQRNVIVEAAETHVNRDLYRHSVEGERVVAAKGPELHQNQDLFEHQVGKDYLLRVDGNLTIAVGGAVTLSGRSLAFKSVGPSEIQAGSSLLLEATGGLAAKAGTGLDLNAGAMMTIAAGMGLKMSSRMAMELSSSMTLDLKAALALAAQGMTFRLKGEAMGEVSAGGLLSLRGALTKIG